MLLVILFAIGSFSFIKFWIVKIHFRPVILNKILLRYLNFIINLNLKFNENNKIRISFHNHKGTIV